MGVTAGHPRPTPGQTLAMTVAVCTRHRTELLRCALDSLMAQHKPPAEVLVVDNAPESDDTREMVAQLYPGCRYIREPLLGLDFARNRALHEAGHETVAFLDDDAVAGQSWAHQMYQTLEDNPLAGVCTGRTHALSQDTEAERLFERNGGFDRGESLVRLPQDARRPLRGLRVPLIAWAISVGNGANFALRRSWALELGGFDEAFELGEALHGGGDLDMFWRVLVAGHELVYQPQAQASHRHRTDVDAVAQQLADHQRALMAFLVKSRRLARGSARLWLTVFILWRLVKPPLRIAKRLVGLDPLPAGILWRMWRRAIDGVTVYPEAARIARSRRLEAAQGTP